MKSGLKLFQFWGIPVYLKWWFLLMLLFIPPINLLIVFFSILIHEMSHAIMAKKLQYKVQKIYLDLFYGAVVIDPKEDENYEDDIKIALAGPISNILIAILSLLYFLAFGDLHQILALVFIINILIGFFNILPIWPLDGGRVTLSIFKKYFGLVGHRYNGILSLCFSVLLLLFSIIDLNLILIITSVIFIAISISEINSYKIKI